MKTAIFSIWLCLAATIVSVTTASASAAPNDDGCAFGPRNSNGVCPDEYGVALDVECLLKWTDGDGGRVHPDCLQAFLFEAKQAGLSAPGEAKRSWKDAMMTGGMAACLYEERYQTGDLAAAARAVRRVVPTLTGGEVFPAADDSPAENLVWIAVGTLCADGTTISSG